MSQFTKKSLKIYEKRIDRLERKYKDFERRYKDAKHDMETAMWMKNVSICLSSHERYSLVGHMPLNPKKYTKKSEFRFHYDYITWLRSVYLKCMKVPFSLDYKFFFNLYKLSDDFLWLLHKIIKFYSTYEYVIGDCPLENQPDILSLCIVSDPWEDLESYRTNYTQCGIRREGSYWEEAYRRMYAREVCDPGGRIERWAPMPVVANEYSIQFAKGKEKDKLCAFMKVMSSKRMHSYPYFYQGGGHRINACSRTPEREYAIRHDELVIRRCKMTIKNIKKYRTKYMDLIIYEYSKLPSFLPLDVRGHIVSFSINV